MHTGASSSSTAYRTPSSKTSGAPSSSSRTSATPPSRPHGAPSRETPGAPSRSHGAPSAYKTPNTYTSAPASTPAPPPSAYAHAYDSRPISSAASSSSHTSDLDSIASTYPSTVASDAPLPREKKRRLFRPRNRIALGADAPPLEPVSDINAKLGRHKTYALRDYLTSRKKDKDKDKGKARESVSASGSGYGSVSERARGKAREASFPPAHWFDGPVSESGRSEYVTAQEGGGMTTSATTSEVGTGYRFISAPATPPERAQVEEGVGDSGDDNEGEGDGDKTPTGERGASEPGTPCAEPGEGGQQGGVGPEPITLARRIQSLLAAIPTSLPSSPNPVSPTSPAVPADSSASSPVAPPPSPATAAEQDAQGVGADAHGPPPVRAITDFRLMSMLSDTSIMNGSLEKGRQSVFAILDKLKLPSRARPTGTSNDVTANPDANQADADVDAGYESDDGSSIMLYGPLVPDEESEAEIARSDVMSVTDDGEMWEYERPARRVSRLMDWEGPEAFGSSSGPEPVQEAAEGPTEEERKEGQEQGHEKEGSAAWRWLESWKSLGKEPEASGSASGAEGAATGPDAAAPVPAPAPIRHVKTKVIWVPSPDKISFQATWWGYRLYLPPPVLDVLNNKRLEAAKRAAIITTALKWLLDSVPVAIVPPQFRAGLLIAQRLVPYLGYVGGFMAWSWGAIKSFDQGASPCTFATSNPSCVVYF
ncbi:hypothetical protein DENSPDRAFT_832939 [Dentipellis sp. KUC8613]|nr:hypothetical protein DENSPDRAFT_832939 [Dentipellis sp. KUC8613]